MFKIALIGTKDGANTTFTLSQASLGPTLIVQAGRILKEVLVNPGVNQNTLSGLTVTTGVAPGASDMFFAYILGDATRGLKEVSVSGLQNGSNTGFTLSESPPASSMLFFKNGLILEEVVSGPTSIQYTLGTGTVTLGLAPVNTDKLRAFVGVPGTAILQVLQISGDQNSANTRFTSTNYTPALGTEPILLTLFDGVLQTQVISNPIAGQYAQSSPTTFLLGTAPASSTSLQFILVGTTHVTVNSYDFTSVRMARRLGIWLQRNLDEAELEEVVGETYRELVDTNQWSFLQVDGVFATEAIKVDGTIAVTTGSQVVSGTGTSFVMTDIGKRFRLSSFSNSYKVINVDVVNQRLEITPPYVDDTATGQTYALIRSVYSLGFDIEYLFSIASRFPMREIPLARLDRVDPTRFSTANVPLYYAYRGKNDKGELEIELYPIPTQATVVRYAGIRRDAITDPDQRLRGIETVVLNAAAAAGCRIIIAKPNIKAEVWMQLMSAYETRALQLLDRIDSLDWTRSTTAQVQGMRDETNSMANDGSYMSSHDTWIGPNGA